MRNVHLNFCSSDMCVPGIILLVFVALTIFLYMFWQLRKGRRHERAGGAHGMIRKPAEIRLLLEGAMRRKTRLEIRLKGGGTAFGSILLGSTAKGSSAELVLDELSPPEGNELLERSDFLAVLFLLKESGPRPSYVPHEFGSRYLGRLEWEGWPALRISMPGYVLRRQRREFLRVRPPHGEDIRVRFMMGGCLHKGVVHNIGGGGLGFYVNLQETPLVQGQEIKAIAVEIPGISVVNCAVVVYILQELSHSVLANGRTFSHCCGARFTDIEEAGRAEIIRYVVATERREIRQRKGEEVLPDEN